MRNPVEIENIEAMRRREGIDDVELRKGIRNLRTGDLVKVTLVTGPNSYETLAVELTRIRGPAFRGKLADQPASAGLLQLRVGATIAFTAAHIHSIPKRRVYP
jgi:hypothetical protein